MAENLLSLHPSGSLATDEGLRIHVNRSTCSYSETTSKRPSGVSR